MFGGLGPPEIIIIFLVIVLLFGGKKLPELAKGLGKGIKEFKKAQTEDDEDSKTDERSKVIKD
jgi:sec-independent protein translocase protein TatA